MFSCALVGAMNPAYAGHGIDLPPAVGGPRVGVPPPVQPISSQQLAVAAVSGPGMYVWQWDRTGSVDQVVARAAASRITHLIVRASSATQGLYLAPILAELLPKAHAAGIYVVAYDPPRFEDIEFDVKRAVDLINFSSSGHRIDAFAADLEPRWELFTPQAVDSYGARLRQVVGPSVPLIAVTFPPNIVGNRVPYAEIARHFDVLSAMSYWRARTTDSVGFVTDSIKQLQAFGKPVAISGQAFSYDGLRNVTLRGHPSPPELEASINAARQAGAVGITFWVWEHAAPWVFDSIARTGWNRTTPPSAGLTLAAPPPPPPPPPPAQVPPPAELPVGLPPSPVKAQGPAPIHRGVLAGFAVLLLATAALATFRSRPRAA